jgi:hypothetical protein
MISTWKYYIGDKRFRKIFLLSFFTFGIVLLLFIPFLTFVEQRQGFVFNDPVLLMFDARELSAFIFTITYAASLFGIMLALRSPVIFTRLIQCYTIMVLLRMLCMWLLPLEPPSGIIPLQDVFLHESFYAGRDNLKDLFFSGHTATLLLLAFCTEGKSARWLLGMSAVIVGTLLMLQHVHYSIDVFAAVLFSWTAVELQRRFLQSSLISFSVNAFSSGKNVSNSFENNE